MIEHYFEKYPGLIFSINFNEPVKSIHFWFPKHWEVPQNVLPETINIVHNNDTADPANPNRYYCVIHPTSIKTGDLEDVAPHSYDDMFNALSDVFEHNIEKARKAELLEQKIQLLQSKFSEMSLEDLQKMDFK